MKSSYNLQKETLLGLINVLVADRLPADARELTGNSGINWLNPQPEPPGASLKAMDATRSIPAVRSLLSLASMEAAAEGDQGSARARKLIEAFVDDYCGTGAPKLLMPAPWPRFGQKPNALDMIVSAAQFHSAAAALPRHALQPLLAAAADRLVEGALARLGEAGR